MKAVATDIIWDKIENSYKYGVTIAYFSKHHNFPYLNARYADQWSEYPASNCFKCWSWSEYLSINVNIDIDPIDNRATFWVRWLWIKKNI